MEEENIKKKRCPLCREMKEEKDYYLRTNGKLQSYCQECTKEKSRIWEENHPGDRLKRNHKNKIYRPMEKAVDCTLYLGVVIAEKVLSNFFNNIIRMPHGNPGFDYICGKGFKIDVKSSCLFCSEKQSPHWIFSIKKNKIADYFLLLGFDNRKDLNPKYVWFIPGNKINNLVTLNITNIPKFLEKWDKYKKPLDKVIMCCNKMREK
jgi:hypothetical protein